MTPSIRRAVALLCSALLLVAACGSDDDTPSQSGAVTDDSTTDGTDDSTTDGTPADAAEDDDADAMGSEDDASVSFSSPSDGDMVAPRFDVVMSATGIEVASAGEVVDGEGHFHVMIDTPCVTPGEAVPSDDQHVHFGKGQTSTQLFLDPGEHDLCLQMADGAHIALDITDEITVEVDDNIPYVTLEVPEGELTSPVSVEMFAQNFLVGPAGEIVEGEGHFHVMVDVDCVTPGEAIPSDDAHLHFGKAQTEADLELEPGTHTLCLQLGDGAHIALDLTHQVTVTVA